MKGFDETCLLCDGETVWQNETKRVFEQEDEWEAAHFSLSREDVRRNAPTADEVVLIVTDEDENTVVTSLDIETGELEVDGRTGAIVAAVAPTATPKHVILGGGTKVATPAITTTVAAGAPFVIGVGTPALAAYGLYTMEAKTLEGEVIGTNTRPMPKTPPAGEWEPPEEGLEITLPSGAVYSEGEFDRGFGEAYIEETTGLTASELDQAFENVDEIIHDDGEGWYVISNEIGEQEVILWIYDGTLVFAEEAIEREEVAEEASEEVNQERDEHEEVSEEEIEDTIEDEPDEVITNDPYHRYEIYRIAEASLQIVVRTTGDKIVDYFVEELEQETRCTRRSRRRHDGRLHRARPICRCLE
ncbi:hypothetical protein [Natronobeatus ordinarius]|uniref:hypothetical protein n=1 Tax=Natronobeatus ordinarius TaxID=2963433 RepID=UPI0020CB87BD|nr:hypothetical protein [Natronobeatus ordinarius]